MVLQERSLIPTLNGLDNLFLNSEQVNPLRVVQRGREADEVASLLDELGIPRLLLRLRVSEMSPIEQELLEIAKALRLGSKVLILDEPTAPLGKDEIDRLFGVMRTVAAQGTGIVLITHHLAEVFAVSDDVTCLREGRVVLSSRTADTTMGELIQAMLGRPSVVTQARTRTRAAEAVPRLEVRDLHVGEKLTGVSFQIGRGEIVGIAGLAGSGRTTLLRTLFGDIRPTSGAILLDGLPYKPRSPVDAIGKGVFLIPEDRAVHGLVLMKTIAENTVMPILQRLVSKLRLLRMSGGRTLTRQLMARLDVRARGLNQVVGELSGGNQQKVVLAKALAVDARLMLLDEPTFGVDIGATREIIRHVRELADAGTSALWVTSDIHELLDVADRVLILREGRIEASIEPGEPGYNENVIIARMQREQYLHLAGTAAGGPDGDG
jgi:ribose transport system ATP-binding protein